MIGESVANPARFASSRSTRARESRWLVDEVFGFAAVKAAVTDLLMHPCGKAAAALITVVWATAVDASPPVFHALTVACWGFCIIDALLAQWYAAKTHRWTRKKTLNWMVKLTVYTFVVAAFWLMGAVVDASHSDHHFLFAFALASFAATIIAVTEFLSLVENANSVLDGRLDRLVTFSVTATRWILRLPEFQQPVTDVEEEVPSGKPRDSDL